MTVPQGHALEEPRGELGPRASPAPRRMDLPPRGRVPCIVPLAFFKAKRGGHQRWQRLLGGHGATVIATPLVVEVVGSGSKLREQSTFLWSGMGMEPR